MRRSTFLQNTATLIGGSLLPSRGFSQKENQTGKIRFAFITDIHIKPEAVAEVGMAKALHHVQSLNPKVDFIVNGGDCIWDALEADKQKTQSQWNLYHSILRKENNLPVHHCIGNHDVWGWFLKENNPEADKLYGKQWAVETLKLPVSYHVSSSRNTTNADRYEAPGNGLVL